MPVAQKLLYDGTVTSAISSLTDVGIPVDVSSMGPPYTLLLATDNAGAVAPTGTLVFQAQVCYTPYAETTASAWEVVAAITSGEIAAAGKQLDVANLATCIGAFVQVQIKATASTAFGSGVRFRVYLCGTSAVAGPPA